MSVHDVVAEQQEKHRRYMQLPNTVLAWYVIYLEARVNYEAKRVSGRQ